MSLSEVALKADIHEHDKFDANDPHQTLAHSGATPAFDLLGSLADQP
jgi:hypothetical protein